MLQPTQPENDLKSAILKTIAFFDLFDYPLTAYEIYKNLDGIGFVETYSGEEGEGGNDDEREKGGGDEKENREKDIGKNRKENQKEENQKEVINQDNKESIGQGNKKTRLPEIIEILNQEVNQKKSLVQEKNGFYFWRGREEIINVRRHRYNYACRKIKIAARFSRLIAFCPSVKMIAAANFIGAYNLRDESDIDFFIVSAPRRLWFTRFCCAGLAKILNRRPTRENKRDRICLSFYISADRLNLDDLKLPGGDPYFEFWRRGLVLLYNKDKTYEKFLTANGLEDRTFPADGKEAGAPVFSEERPETDRSGSFNQFPSEIGSEGAGKNNFFLNKLEFLAKFWQLKILPPNLKAAMNNSDGVIITDQVLKLYERDRRREYAEKYGNKIQQIFKEND